MITPHREKDIERFDRWANTYDHSWLQRALFDRVHQALLALTAGIVHQPGNILDIGCGTGKLLRLAALSWPQAQLIGVDPANGMIDMAQRFTPNATFFPCAAEALPLPDASVDLALSTMSFHHWQYQSTGLREIARVLRPGGYFILVDGTFPDWLVRVARTRHFHSRAGLSALFVQAGLHVQTQQSIIWRNLSATVGKK